MTDENLDRILGNEEVLVPSSGFVASVMERIREEIAAPAPVPLPPIPFPWKRAVPGIVLGALGLGWGLVEVSRQAMEAARAAQPVTLTIPSTAVAPLEGLAWAGLALALSLASWKLARRGESSLL